MANARKGAMSIAKLSGGSVMFNPAQRAESRKLTLSPAEAAAELNVSRSQLYVLMRRGELPSVKIGRRRVILWDDLVAYLKSLRAKQVAKRAK
jgi:excisionase family DNA binding protein